MRKHYVSNNNNTFLLIIMLISLIVLFETAVFAFDLYDNDAKGVLKKDDLELMFRELLSVRQLGTKTAKK